MEKKQSIRLKWRKERISSERMIALQNMIQTAKKHCQQVVPILEIELDRERVEIEKKNIGRKRQNIIGEK